LGEAVPGSWPAEGSPGWPEGTSEALETAGLNPEWVGALVSYALSEDLGGNPGRDVTTQSTVRHDADHTVHLVARADGVLAGTPFIPVVLADVAGRIGHPIPTAEYRVADGSVVRAGDVVCAMTGSAHVLLMAERTMLNLLCRASGVATHTRAWTDELAGTDAQVLDTRKTTPGLRALEKYAVRCGGGTNKRMGLFDVAMIKDNHKLAAGSVSAAFAAVTKQFPDLQVEVEVTNVAEAREAVAAGARFLLCDNMDLDTLTEAVKVARAETKDTVEIEATGGLTLDVAVEYARTGVDFLSVGALTHSSPVLDMALDIVD
jgi:nicotinate-nucleotide pyrophosphorylase (carboxylating)